MVLNKNNDASYSNSSSSYSSESEGDGDDRWEMVDNDFEDNGGDDDYQRHHPQRPKENDETNELELEVHDTEDQSHRVLKDTNKNQFDDKDEDVSIAVESAVSSITRECHATVSEVDDDVMKEMEDGLELGAVFSNVEGNATEKSEAEEDENILVIIDQLTNMGFAKEQIEKAIRELRNTGVAASSTAIDADAIIGMMFGEDHTTAATSNNNNENHSNDKDKYQPTHPLQLPLECTIDYLHSTMQELKDQHQELRHRAKNCVDNVSQSARDIWSNVVKEKDNALPLLLRRRSNNSNHRDTTAASNGDNKPASSSSHQQNRYGTTPSTNATRTSILESIRRANDEHHIAEKVAAIAVVGSATLLAFGHPRACLGVAAVAGASLAVGEGVVRQQERQRQHNEEGEMQFHQSTTTTAAVAAGVRDFGLGKNDLHLD